MAIHNNDDDDDQVGIPLLDREASSQDPILHNRRARPSSPLRLVLAIALLVLLGLAAFHGWAQGRPAVTKYRKLWNPHGKQLHLSNGSIAAETELVRALFGPEKELGVDRFDLVASVWVQERDTQSYGGYLQKIDNQQNATTENATTSATTGPRISGLNSVVISLDGSGRFSDDDGHEWTSPPEPEWQRLFSEPVMRGLKISESASTVVKVVIPGRIVKSLRTQYYGTELRGTFHLIPSVSTLPFFASNVTRYRGPLTDRDRYGRYDRYGDRMPLPYPAVGVNASEQKEHDQPWESRIPGTKAINLVRRIVPHWSLQEERYIEDNDAEDDADEEIEEAAETESGAKPEIDYWMEDNESGRPRDRTAIVKRSMVTLINETPVYSLSKFKRKMRKLKKIDEDCDRGKRRWETCTKTFANRGHFEQLMQMATQPDGDDAAPAEVVGYRYPPFLHSNYGRIGPKDYTNLTEPEEDLDTPHVAEEPDFEFDWHVSFAPISSLKAALAEVYHQTYGGRDFDRFGDDHMLFEKTGQDSGPWQDQAELLSAIMGHSFTSGSRPILRLILTSLAALTALLSTLLTAYFWYSRVLTTGIAILPHAIDTLVRFVAFGVGVVQRGQKRDWMISPVVLLMSCLVWSLCARLEWVGGGPRDLVLVGVRRRRATKGERASTREEGKVGWWIKGALAAVTFLFATFALPLIPPIISSSSSLSPSSSSSTFFPLLRPLVQTSSVLLFWSQFLLNEGLSKFGASFRIVAYLDLLSFILLDTPVVLSGSWGRWETMPDLVYVDLIRFVGKGALALQAWRYPEVEQKEDEEN